MQPASRVEKKRGEKGEAGTSAPGEVEREEREASSTKGTASKT